MIQPYSLKDAREIARAFLPQRAWGNRHDYYYSQVKLHTDPLYPAVLQALSGTQAAVLDLGCGLGLLAHTLRRDGQMMPYYGVDLDADKIGRGQQIAAKSGFKDVRLEVLDLGQGMPQHQGSVTILDVLQFLSSERQAELVAKCASCLTPGSKLVIRTALAGDARLSRMTRILDHAAHKIGWMQAQPKHYPDLDQLETLLSARGLKVSRTHLSGPKTPFNLWLMVAEKV